jgi:hypothetical protein
MIFRIGTEMYDYEEADLLIRILRNKKFKLIPEEEDCPIDPSTEYYVEIGTLEELMKLGEIFGATIDIMPDNVLFIDRDFSDFDF